MPFNDLDTAALSRALAQIAERPEDQADVYFERREVIALPPEDETPGLRVRREEGLAVRLLRDHQTWLAGRDAIDTAAFRQALRRAARALPRAAYPEPQLAMPPWEEPPHAPELLAFPTLVTRAVREHHVDIPCRLTVRRHRRWLRVIGTRLSSAAERESFYSLVAELEDGTRCGSLLGELGLAAAEDLARRLVRATRARDATPPDAWRGPTVLGPAATATLLHEAVAHALEADTLALGGDPEAAVGVSLGASSLNVIDDPATAPAGVRRSADDEGFPVFRRWLLRAGVVEQPLCDSLWARRSEILTPGAARRGGRHQAPGPRLSHLELLPGTLAPQELLADAEDGLYLAEAERGSLDPRRGTFALHFPFGHRICNQTLGDPVGPCTLHGNVADILHAVTGIGSEVRAAGAGWCAKGGVRLPTWATVPALRLEGIEVRP